MDHIIIEILQQRRRTMTTPSFLCHLIAGVTPSEESLQVLPSDSFPGCIYNQVVIFTTILCELSGCDIL